MASNSQLCFGCGKAFAPGTQLLTALGTVWHPSCLRCAQCDKVLEIGRAKCDNSRRLAYCTLECAMAASPAAPIHKAVTSPSLATSATTTPTSAPSRSRDAATDVGVTPSKAKLSQFERVLDLRAVDLSQLHAQIDLARSQQAALSPTSMASSSSSVSIKSPPLSPASPLDDDDVALQRWRDAERRRADLESQIEIVTQRRNSRRSNPASAAAPPVVAAAADDDAEDEQRIATLRRESEQAATEVARAQEALSPSQRARADRHKTKHAHHKKSRAKHSRSPSPPPPASLSPAQQQQQQQSTTTTTTTTTMLQKSSPPRHVGGGDERAEVSTVVQNARAGDTSTMVQRRDMVKSAMVQRRIDMRGNGEDTFK